MKRGIILTKKQAKEKLEESEYYTGNKSKDLIVHVMQDGIEIDKPIKTKIFARSVIWKNNQYPIIPKRFYTDYSGLNHMQVDSRDMAVLTFHKDHTDKCKKCGGKMTIDAEHSRMLGRHGIIKPIWGLESTHMILMLVCFAIAMAGIGFGFYSYNQDTLHKAQLENAQREIARLNLIINPNPDPELPDGTVQGGVRK